MIENIDYVVCPICFQKMKQITYKHLKKHNLTIKEFKIRFSDKNLQCNNTLEKKSKINKGEKQSQETIQKRVCKLIGKKRVYKVIQKIKILREIRVCPTCNKECEVFTRVCGYLRPVQQFNIGKKLEYKDRKLYKI